MAQTNHEFSKTNELFKLCCDLASLPATKRQASKFRHGRGRAYAKRTEALEDRADTPTDAPPTDAPAGGE